METKDREPDNQRFKEPVYGIRRTDQTKEGAVLHQKHDGSWEVINPDSVGNGTVTATFTSLSPIAFVAYNASAQTGETTPVLPIIALICVAGIAVCGTKVKFNN